jgi:hypothetical protein
LCYLAENDPRYKSLWSDSPSIVRKAMNFASSLTNHIANGFKKTSQDVLKNRIELCLICDFVSENQKTCLKCGCPVEKKASWASESCPIGKWLAEKDEKKQGGCGCNESS